jgi:hypothetical protein
MRKEVVKVADAVGQAAELAQSWLSQAEISHVRVDVNDYLITLHVRMSTYEDSTWDLMVAHVDQLARELQAANAYETVELEVEFENEDGSQWIA